MVLLHVPFRIEEVDVLDSNRYRNLYDEQEALILKAHKEFQSNLDTAALMKECRCLFTEDKENNSNEKTEEYVFKMI